MSVSPATYAISGLYIYPVKSLGGIPLASAHVHERGFTHDRRWMVTDNNHELLTQRTHPLMALIGTAVGQGGLTLSYSGAGTVTVPLTPANPTVVRARVWDDWVSAQTVSPEADRWLSAVLGTACQLVFMPEASSRPIEPAYAPEGMDTSFADSLPYLVIGQAALDALNQRLPQPVLMDRLRPNIVFTGGQAHDEDHWLSVLANKVPFRVGKPCDRCMLINVNQQTGQKGTEPLRTMSQYRNFNGQVMFGQKLVALEQGTLRVGDALYPELKK